MDVMERGHIYFFYRPRVETHDPESLEEIQRFYMVLHPRGQKKYRFIVIGRKKMPEPSQSGREKYWGFVDRVVSDPKEFDRERLEEQHYETATRGHRTQPAARPAGEGVYAIVDHDSHVHLAYVLELPKKPGPVQETLNIEEEASYIISVKNPEASAPLGVGLTPSEQVQYPKPLEEEFEGKRFMPPKPELLDYEKAEIILISAAEDVKEELGIDLNVEHESARSAAIFKDLRLEKGAHPLEPLFEGEWA
jgi:hypothetical protein